MEAKIKKNTYVEGLKYQLKEGEFVQWLELYGKPMGPIQEVNLRMRMMIAQKMEMAPTL
jgi:hypothetical protein